MGNFFSNLFDIERYMPHGYCLLWQPELVWMHVISDVIIAIAYFAIPVTMLILIYKRNTRVPFKWVFVMFALFIIFCGITHLISMIVLWHPMYYLQGVIKALTAVVSIATAILLFPILPKLMDIFKDIDEEREGDNN